MRQDREAAGCAPAVDLHPTRLPARAGHALGMEGRRALEADRFRLAGGRPCGHLPESARAADADLLSRGMLARLDAIGDLIGETAESIIRRARCSVPTEPWVSHPTDVRADLAMSEPNDTDLARQTEALR